MNSNCDFEKLKNETCLLTVGNFDGVHRGHQSLISTLVDKATKDKQKSVVITFVPHPSVFFKNSRHLIFNYHNRVELLKRYGVDYVIELNFDDKLRNMTALDFLNELKQLVTFNKVIIGHDFVFGKDMKDIESLPESSSFEVIRMAPFKQDKEIISSSLIRKYLDSGNIEIVNKLLGHSYFIQGCVVKGKQLGRTIGFPTANINVHDDLRYPQSGVYKGYCIVDDKEYKCILNLGKNPTVANSTELKLEVHIIDFDEYIYNKSIKVYPISYIREERKFNSIDDLKKQIANDLNLLKE